MCRIIIILLMILTSITTAADIAGQVEFVDDKYYPTEEKTERDAIVWPILIELRPGGAVLQKPGEPVIEVRIGRQYDKWTVVAILPGPEPVAVLERNFARWGLIAYIGNNGPIAKIRKAVGRLDTIQKGRAFPKEYFDQILNAKEDVLGKKVLSTWKEPSYENIVGLLPPLKTYTFLGTINARRKLAVLPDGRMGHLKTSPYNKARGLETVYFDPWKHFTGKDIPSRDSLDLAGKEGLLGGYLPAVDFGFYDSNKKWGWEQTGFAVESSDHPSGIDALVSLKSINGERIYKRVFSSEKLDAATFYRELLALKRKWESFFDKGMKVHTADTRAIDAGRAAIIHSLITYIGLEPRYGLGHYWGRGHGSFPPTNYFMNTSLLEWGFEDEAKERLEYYLNRYVKPDGTLNYYGPAVAEYGELLALVARCVQLGGDSKWFLARLPKLDLIIDRLLAELKESRKKYDLGSNQYGLLYGSPEADTRKDKRFWFSGSIWCWRGLKEIGKVESGIGEKTANSVLKQRGEELQREAAIFRKHIITALERSIRTNTAEPFLPPCTGYDGRPFEKMNESTFSNYTNYRYWLEMLSGGLMNDLMNNAIIDYRRDHGGELMGMTRFSSSADNWPYCHFAWGLMNAKQRKQYQLGFYAHIAHHQTRGTFTAYEQVKIIGTKESNYSERKYGAHYCVPSQAVVPITLKWMLVWEDLDSEQLWLAEAVPQSWFDKGFTIENAPTRWGDISLTVSPGGKTGQIVLAKPTSNIKIHLHAPQLTSLSINGRHADFARNGDYVEYNLSKELKDKTYNRNRIGPYSENPRYWQYKDEPLLLLGGTKDDNLFQIPDLKEHLDLLASVGGNYIRNTMSARGDRGLEIQAFKRLPDGKYDLNHWNDEYWRRFESFLKLTNQRDIIVQIEVWAFHDFNKGHWEKNPWHPANNINFNSSNTTLRDSYGNIGRTAHDFFFTVPKLNNDRVVLSYQQKFVDKMLSYTLSHNHVLYCMTNEIHPQFSPEWGWYWSKYIKDKAAAVGRQVETTEMYWEIDLKKEQQRASLDHPEIYSYFEASQNSAKRGQENWDNLQFVYKYLAEKQRPINHVKIYGADSCPWEKSTTRHASECFWRNILGGSASSRFHRPPYGMGLGKKAQAHIKSMRLLTAELDIFNAVPDSRSRLLSNRSDNEAYLSYIPRKQYTVYFPNGGSVDLDLHEATGQYVMKWLDIAQSRWTKEETLEGGGTVTLSPPGTGHWVVWIGQVSTSKKAKTGSQRVGACIIKALLGPAPEPQVLVLMNPEKWRLVLDEGYTGRNAREFFFTLETEAGLPPPEVEVKWPGVEIERVLGADGNTTGTSEGVRFRVAQNNGAPVKTITSIDYGKNVNLILFHNWIIRRAGKYRTGKWPANEIQAQLNYLLAAREVCFDMGLAEAPDPGFVGSVGLYGFETNFPHGHVDHPPHFHILLVWPGWLSTQATHFRLDAEGSILHNEFHVNDGRNVTSRTFERGETCSCKDREGRVGFQLTILEDGSGVIWSWPDRADYMMKADSVAGSAVNAVEVFKKVNGNWERIRWVRVEYHISLGLLKVHLSYADGKAGMEEIHFDPDTGRLLK